MQGLGNDYIYVNCFEQKIRNPAKLAKIVSDRHFGIGADGLILVGPSRKAHAKMRIFNADGSEAEMCGNGIRCVAKFTYERKLAKPAGAFNVPCQKPCPASLKIETRNGVITVGLLTDKDDKVQKVCVNMGQPILTPEDIPVKLPVKNLIDQPMQFMNRAFTMTCVSMGNPHAVFFRDDVDSVDLEKFGPAIENHDIFPNRINVHFVQVIRPGKLKIRTWERGSGVTLACGTGACACCVAGVLTNRSRRVVTAQLPGGDLNLNFSEADNCVYMTGPAVEVFEGCWPDV